MDEWIDRALSIYMPADPPLGLEQRILAHARAPRRTVGLWLAAAAATSAVGALILFHPFAAPRSPMPQAALPVRATAPIIAVHSLPHRAIARRKLRRALPKLAVFPQIERVPDAEVQLARLALNPEIGKALLAQPEITEPEPIHIEPLSIKLLDED